VDKTVTRCYNYRHMTQQSEPVLGESPFVRFGDRSIEVVEREQVLARYSINGASPAAPELVQVEQLIISDDIETRLMRAIPAHFADSMRHMLRAANGTTFSTLSIENQCSYGAVRDKTSSTPPLEIARMKFERGLATPKEVLDTVIDLGADSGEVLKRTELTEQIPNGLVTDLVGLMSAIEKRQGSLDTSEITRQSVKVKQIDVPIGTGGANGLILSVKSDVATIEDGIYTLTCRTKFVVDFDALPMKWRSQLRKLIADVEVRKKAVSTTGATDFGAAALRHLTVPDVLDTHIQLSSEMRLTDNDQDDSESVRRQALYEQLLTCPNPENLGETLRDVTIDKPYAYHFTTTAYVYRTELSAC